MAAKIIDGKQMTVTMLLFNTINSAERATAKLVGSRAREEESVDAVG